MVMGGAVIKLHIFCSSPYGGYIQVALDEKDKGVQRYGQGQIIMHLG